MTHSHTARTISSLKPLFVTGVVSAILTMIARYYFQYDNIEDDVGIWGGFFTVFGVIYAIVAGFLLVEVLGRYSTLSNTIEAELNAVECLRDYLVYLDDDQHSIKSEIRASLKNYLISVRDEEWPAMSEENRFVDSDTSDELYAVMRAVKGIVSHADIDGVVLGSLVEKISDTTVQRTLRISLSNQRLPDRLRLLLVFMGIVLAIGFLVVPVVNVWVHLLMTTTLAMAVHLLNLIIDDLDHPFFGVWNLNREALDQLIERLGD